MNKRANLLMSDLTWFIVFVVVATLAYIVLFRGLEKLAENTIDVRETNVDADFIAESLIRMPVQAQNQYDGKQLSELLVALANQNQDTSTPLEESDAYKTYTQFLDNTFKDKSMQGTTSYAVVMRTGDKYLASTCKSYGKDDSLCTPIQKSKTTINPRTGIRVPSYTQKDGPAEKPGIAIQIDNPRVHVGTAYIPRASEPVILQVVVSIDE